MDLRLGCGLTAGAHRSGRDRRGARTRARGPPGRQPPNVSWSPPSRHPTTADVAPTGAGRSSDSRATGRSRPRTGRRTYWPSLPRPARTQCFVTAVVPAHRCGAVPDSHRVPSCLATDRLPGRTSDATLDGEDLGLRDGPRVAWVARDWLIERPPFTLAAPHNSIPSPRRGSRSKSGTVAQPWVRSTPDESDHQPGTSNQRPLSRTAGGRAPGAATRPRVGASSGRARSTPR